MNYLARIRVPAEVGGWIIVLGAPFLAAGIIFTVGEPIAKLITRNLSESERKKHIVTRAVTWLALLSVLIVVLIFSLPAFGITPLGDPFNIAPVGY
ncbi:Kef-type K+ transport system membrane component KefB [Breznakia sp. PF5-3]|uniref:hypothetical protein n=1 Tax=unclassified Breznakia TaxID=2623764 RepID=UPI0024062711|nr:MULTISPECIES: hypothetical protein [unclassified Breznakia]MDF9825057.1 Kef-type K+ transport system membrane component KefB [Breznakia sp. PM6-1]MDF9835904.1 Kef-type K+ transport system membrane component KefB [Breznakia sp. PF5-3]MDF9837365.1 Kef-type K+ transport system membrane component KefB [Breznakia sp. PFB2-8]MDF9859300.1 Kef-type K+ transport system membrane component KefB [Breznakia sp. PH5-24]